MNRIENGILSLKAAINIRKKIKKDWNEEIAKELDNLIESLDEKNRVIPNPKDTKQEARMTEERW